LLSFAGQQLIIVQVSISSTLNVPFSAKMAPKITKLCFGFEIFLCQNIDKKSTHKMLMKLTPDNTKIGFHGTNIDFNITNDQSLLKRNFQTSCLFWKSILNQNQKFRTQIFDFLALKMICCMNSSLPITLS